MLQSIRNLRKKKGFTLVEVIIVLVILAILAAILIPSLTGYIDKANEKAAIANCRSYVMAAQTIASETYGEQGKLSTGTSGNVNDADFFTESFKLAELDQTNFGAEVEMEATGKVTKVTFNDGSFKVVFENAKYTATADPTAPGTHKLTIKK